MKFKDDSSALSQAVLKVHDSYMSTTSTGTKLPYLDAKVLLLDATGKTFEGCLSVGKSGRSGYYWCRYNSDQSMSELAGDDIPIS